MKPQPPRHFLNSKNPRKELSKPGTESLESRERSDQKRHHLRDLLYTRWTGWCATSGRSRRPNFTANRRRTRPDRAGEAAAAATVITGLFLTFSAISGHFRPPHSSFPPFLDLLNSSTWSLFADFTLFGSYNENKIGRSLDRVFRPPQRLLDQGNGTNEFLVSWAFH